MKKMPCLFVREFHGPGSFSITDQVTPGCEWALAGEGVPSRKWDGTACAIVDGKLYKRYDAKAGKKPPPESIPCDPTPDPVTGHWPHWVLATPSDNWHAEAWDRQQDELRDRPGTYELVGPKINGNPESLNFHKLLRHGEVVIPIVARTFEGLRNYLTEFCIEGIVFAQPDGRRCKIRRDDFGLDWPISQEKK